MLRFKITVLPGFGLAPELPTYGPIGSDKLKVPDPSAQIGLSKTSQT